MHEEFRHLPGARPGDPLVIELAGISYCDGSYRIERRRSPVCVIEYIRRGRGHVLCNGESYAPQAGDAYILPAGSDHVYRAEPADPWEKIWFNLRGPLPDRLLAAYGLAKTVHIPDCCAESAFDTLYALLGQDGTSTAHACALALHTLIARMADAACTRAAQGTPEAETLRRHLDTAVERQVTLSELAALVGRSPSQTIRLFRHAQGCTPYAYLLRRKLDMAESLLSGTRLPIGEIARRLAFSDARYFSGQFKKRCGVSPSAYRVMRTSPDVETALPDSDA